MQAVEARGKEARAAAQKAVRLAAQEAARVAAQEDEVMKEEAAEAAA
jgi:hypothetical protein